MQEFLQEFLYAWYGHWGWLWMLVGLFGYCVIVVVADR